MSSLNILAGKNGVVVNDILSSADMGLGVSVKLLGLAGEVEVDGVRPSESEEDERDAHGVPGANLIGNIPKNDGDDGTTADGGDEEGGTTLGVATETTKGEGEDDGEDAGLEEEHDHEHGKTAPVRSGSTTRVDTDGGSDEDHDHGLEDQEDDTRLSTNVHEPSSCETTDCEQSLGDGVEVGTLDVSLCDIEIWTSLREVVDEVGGNTDLGADVGELSEGTPEEGVLLAERLVDVAGSASGHLSLVGHVTICYFGNGSEVEHDSENGDECSDTKVDVLHGLEGFAILSNMLEDDLGGKHGSDDGANSLNGLRQFQTELRPLGGTADRNIGICADFEGGETRSSQEHGTAEATEASFDRRRPEHERTDAVDRQSQNESVSVSEPPQEPTRVSKRTNKVRSKVRSLETRRFTLGDVESDLEAGVEDIEQTVREPPHEEEGSDERNRNDGLAGSELRGTGDNAVVDALAAGLFLDDLDDGGATTLLLMDFFHCGFLRTVHAEELHHSGDLGPNGQ